MNALIAAAIHDAKNALHAVCAQLTRAAASAPSAELAEAQALAARVDAQLVELLAIYRASEGHLQLSIADRDLLDFIEELRIEPLNSGTVAVSYELAEAEQIGVWAFDAYLVKLVLLDALRNAVRHAHGQVVFDLTRCAEGGIEFRVRDDGPGFPSEVLAGANTAMGADSSGLGLLFARLIASRHATPDGRHGALELCNAGGAGGACLRLRLP